MIDLFPREAIDSGATPPPELDGAALAQARIRDWAAEWDAHRRAQVGDATPELQELAGRFESWFMPTTETIARNAKFGIGNAGIVARYLKGLDAYAGSRTEFTGGLPAQVAHIEVVVEISHSYDGLPERWRVTRTSGDASFDDAAMAAIKDGLTWSDQDKLVSSRPARQTVWSFEARAYRYYVIEYAMSPGLVGRGSDLGDYDDGFGKTQIIRRARLLAVVYWSPSTDGGPIPSGPIRDRGPGDAG